MSQHNLETGVKWLGLLHQRYLDKCTVCPSRQSTVDLSNPVERFLLAISLYVEPRHRNSHFESPNFFTIYLPF